MSQMGTVKTEIWTDTREAKIGFSVGALICARALECDYLRAMRRAVTPARNGER